MERICARDQGFSNFLTDLSRLLELRLMIQWLRKIENPTLAQKMKPNSTILHINDMHLLVMDQDVEAVRIDNSSNPQTFTNQLTIRDVRAEDAGAYFCVVSNAMGQFVYRSVHLKVFEGNAYIAILHPTPCISWPFNCRFEIRLAHQRAGRRRRCNTRDSADPCHCGSVVAVLYW